MGTHPIFESDFDCLTEIKMSSRARKTIDDELQKVEFETSEEVDVVPTFDSMGIREDLLRGIYAYGFEKPSSIQQRAIVPIIKGRDVIAQAQSGTGKTATFAISTLQSIDTSLKAVQALILAPTRELANQIIKVLTALGDYMEASCYACIGGTNVRNEIKMLKEGGYQIIVGTPGRVLDMIANRGAIDTSTIKMFILDEADEMLSKGFKDGIYDIFRELPGNIQVVLLSLPCPMKFWTSPN